MKVVIDYSDGQYTMWEATGDWVTSQRVIEMDDRDWQRYLAFRAVAGGWDAFIRDLDARCGKWGEAYGPRPKRMSA